MINKTRSLEITIDVSAIRHVVIFQANFGYAYLQCIKYFLLMHGSILPVTISPPGHTPGGLQFFFSLGGLFPTPRHAERDNSPPLGLIDHKYVVL